jgi:hypothetical protein
MPKLTAHSLFCFFHYFHQSPALRFAKRAGFHDTNSIAHGALVLFVVCMKLRCFLNELSVDGVFHFSFNRYRNGFIHLVAGYDTGSCFSKISFFHFY